MSLSNNSISVSAPSCILGHFAAHFPCGWSRAPWHRDGQASCCSPGEACFIHCLPTGLRCLSLAGQNKSSAVLLVAAEEYVFGRLKEQRWCLLQGQGQQSKPRLLGFAQWLQQHGTTGERYIQRHLNTR